MAFDPENTMDRKDIRGLLASGNKNERHNTLKKSTE
jgi:hypothetical protein